VYNLCSGLNLADCSCTRYRWLIPSSAPQMYWRCGC